MMKENYERTELDIIRFQTRDVIMTTGEYEDPEDDYMMPIR